VALNKPVKRGDILKWGEGVELTAVYAGWRPITVQGRESFLVDFELPDHRKVTYGCPVVLKSILDNVGLGVPVRVVCKGKAPTASGQMAWQFDVFTEGDEDEDLPF
jgi:hypothetical protein